MSSLKFRARIDARNRIQVPPRIESFHIGDEVLVTLEEYKNSKKKDSPNKKQTSG